MTSRRIFLTGLAALPFVGLAGRPSLALAGETILTLRGDFAKAGADGSLAYDLAGLDALPQTAFETTTPWSEGVIRFSGVALKDFFEAAGASPSDIRMIALNDYMTEADVSELIGAGAILATRAGGAPLPLSEKGPIFVVMPFDSRADIRHQTFFSRCVWQLSEIEIVA